MPGVGDAAAAAASSYILLQAVRMGAPWSLTLRMALNILLESIVGAIPVFGDLFDFVFKANQRNVRLILDYDLRPTPVRRRSILVLLGAMLLVVTGVAAAFWLVLLLLETLEE